MISGKTGRDGSLFVYYLILSYDVVVNKLEEAISGDGNTVFRTADSESFDVKTGKYTRQCSWIYTSCPSS